MTEGLHHYHKRKRIHQKHEPYPHPDRFKRFIDKAIYGVGITGPIVTLPQATKIWTEQSAAGVSVFSWAAWMVLAVFWITYGIMHKEKPIIITYCCWLLLEATVVTGALIYG